MNPYNFPKTQAFDGSKNKEWNSPISRCGAVTLDSYFFYNGSTTPEIARGLHIGGPGDLVIETVDGAVVTFFNVLGGAPYGYECRRVLAGTTATNITWIGGN